MSRPRLEETGRGLTVHAAGRYLYSRHQPNRRSERAAASVPVENRCIYLVPSPLLGYGLFNLADRIPEDSIILAIEQSQELMALCSPYIQEDLRNDSRIIQVRLSDKSSLHALLYKLGPWRFRRVRRIDLNGGASLNPGLYDELTSFLMEDLHTYWRNRHALGRLGREWIRHVFANLSEMACGKIDFRSLTDLKIHGIPFVVGAGPSLETALPYIRRFRDYLWVLATDTAVPALLSAGIEPDAATVLETQAWNLLDFHDTGSGGMSVIADLTAYPPSLTHTGGPCYLFSSTFAELRFLKRLDESGLRSHPIPPLGSVGLVALEIAMGLTPGPVILTGLDFAYSPGKSHARGTAFHRWQISAIQRLNPHPGWKASMKRPRLKSSDAAGNLLNTDAVLEGYAAMLKDRYSGENRLYVLEPGGLDLGLPVISETEAEKLLHANPQPGPLMNVSPDRGCQQQKGSEIATSFLDSEQGLLKGITETWNAYAGGDGSAAALVSALEGMDEVFADFPDEPPLPKEDDSFLVRAVRRSRQLNRYIDRVRS